MTAKRGVSRVPAIAACLLSIVAFSAFAHHTFAMFDVSKKLTLQGTVKELQWTNPHCFLQVLVSKDGRAQEWSLQMNAPLDLYRNGWRPRSLQAGDKITVIVNPSKDGTHSGRFISGTGPDGKALSAA
jgi:hypothetical protein